MSAGYIRTTLLDICVVAIRHLLDEFIGAGKLTRTSAHLVSSILITPAEILVNRSAEQCILLQHNGDFISKCLHVVFPDILASNSDAALRHIIQTADQADKTRLRATGSADDANRLTRFNRYIDILQYEILRRLLVTEIYMIELHASVRYFHIWLFRILQGRILVDHLCDTSRTRHTHTDHDKYHRKHHQAHQDIHAVCKQAHQITCRKRIAHDHVRTNPAD